MQITPVNIPGEHITINLLHRFDRYKVSSFSNKAPIELISCRILHGLKITHHMTYLLFIYSLTVILIVHVSIVACKYQTIWYNLEVKSSINIHITCFSLFFD